MATPIATVLVQGVHYQPHIATQHRHHVRQPPCLKSSSSLPLVLEFTPVNTGILATISTSFTKMFFVSGECVPKIDVPGEFVEQGRQELIDFPKLLG